MTFMKMKEEEEEESKTDRQTDRQIDRQRNKESDSIEISYQNPTEEKISFCKHEEEQHLCYIIV